MKIKIQTTIKIAQKKIIFYFSQLELIIIAIIAIKPTAEIRTYIKIKSIRESYIF